MSYDHKRYMPCLRWKQGEYQAIMHLSSRAKNLITPLIEIPEMGFDFETGKNSKSIDDHVSKFADRILKKWGKAGFFLDMSLVDPTNRMADGSHPLSSVFADLRGRECSPIPVTGVHRDLEYQKSLQQIITKEKRGVCFRVTLEEAAGGSLKTDLDKQLKGAKLSPKDCDLLLDLASPNYEPVDGFSKLIFEIIKSLPYLKEWRSFVLLGTSFPSTMAEVSHGQSVIPRSEWTLYKDLLKKLSVAKIRIPTFGDYTINHPSVSKIDMRFVKPFATIRYTIDDGWLIIKGNNIRDFGYGQYKDHCSELMKSSYYFGDSFSQADDYISKCARGMAKNGNLSTWRWVGTNHHLEKLTQDISKLFGTSNNP